HSVLLFVPTRRSSDLLGLELKSIRRQIPAESQQQDLAQREWSSLERASGKEAILREILERLLEKAPRPRVAPNEYPHASCLHKRSEEHTSELRSPDHL